MTISHIFVLSGLIFLPWLNPFAPGPSPAVVPLLFSWFCATVVLGIPAWRELNSQVFAKLVAWSWLTAAMASCAIGLLQYHGVANNLALWINQTRPGEAFANLRQRNQYASLTNMGLAVVLWWAAQVTPQAGSIKRTCFSWQVAAVSLLAVGNAISSSRTGLLQLLLLCGLYITWGDLRNAAVHKLLLWAVLVYAVAMFALPQLAGFDPSTHGAFVRLGSDDACNSRITLWSNVLHLIAQKPWLGWGWGELDYAHFITLYNEPRFCDILDNAHNLPLHLAVELGVPAALLICGGFTWWVWRQKPWAERDATRQLAWAVMAVILLHSMLEYPLWYGPFQMAFGLCILLLWRRQQPLEAKNNSKFASNRPLAQLICALTATFLIAFISYAAWDYHRISQIYLEPESRSAGYRTDTLNKIRGSWLFADQVRFAALLTTPLTPANAAWTLATTKQLLQYSPEARVVEKLIESAVLLGEDDEALAYLARYRAAFPKEHARWTKANQTLP